MGNDRPPSSHNEFFRIIQNPGQIRGIRILSEHVIRIREGMNPATFQVGENIMVYMVFASGKQSDMSARGICGKPGQCVLNPLHRIRKHLMPVMRRCNNCAHALVRQAIHHPAAGFIIRRTIIYPVQYMTMNINHGILFL